jgi:CBS domain-containing protein
MQLAYVAEGSVIQGQQSERIYAMKKSRKVQASKPLKLHAQTAKELMTSNPVSIGADETVKEAIAFLADKGFSAAPVIDDAGRPIGVLSRSDIVIHDREKVDYVPSLPEAYERSNWAARSGEPVRRGFQVEHVEQIRVRDIMTPVVFSVGPHTSAEEVIREMLDLRVHQLFVVDGLGVLVGIISALDVIRRIGPEEMSPLALATVDK